MAASKSTARTLRDGRQGRGCELEDDEGDDEICLAQRRALPEGQGCVCHWSVGRGKGGWS